ncbi:hypothetical protein [Polaromonas sp.]|uniref:hypothetical protein n=1 Tax=Polaromonas sp. TaxID=1869339 RepID=UPI002BC9713C|nr:hypothetical protein [Polaromonas sp.]HQS31054.1 hypothetical protein [Polaromonas sp.]HQS90193.1 hypothetical protein [Polaromonas sp.]
MDRAVHRLSRLLFLSGLYLLEGCTSSSDDGSLFPLEAGRSWTYRVVTSADDPAFEPYNETLLFETYQSSTELGKPASRRRSSSGSEYWLRSDATGVYRVASKGPLDVVPQVDAEPRYVLRKPYAVGTEWVASTTPYVLQRRNEFPRELRYLKRYKSLPMKYRIEALDQTVKSPAGPFAGCVKVLGRADIRLYVDELFVWRDVPITTREWYCPGVGLARLEREERSPSKFIVGGTVIMELTAWR